MTEKSEAAYIFYSGLKPANETR